MKRVEGPPLELKIVPLYADQVIRNVGDLRTMIFGG